MFGALIAVGDAWLMSHYNPDSFDGFFLTGPFDHAETGLPLQNHFLFNNRKSQEHDVPNY